MGVGAAAAAAVLIHVARWGNAYVAKLHFKGRARRTIGVFQVSPPLACARAGLLRHSFFSLFCEAFVVTTIITSTTVNVKGAKKWPHRMHSVHAAAPISRSY